RDLRTGPPPILRAAASLSRAFVLDDRRRTRCRRAVAGVRPGPRRCGATTQTAPPTDERILEPSDTGRCTDSRGETPSDAELWGQRSVTQTIRLGPRLAR